MDCKNKGQGSAFYGAEEIPRQSAMFVIPLNHALNSAKRNARGLKSVATTCFAWRAATRVLRLTRCKGPKPRSQAFVKQTRQSRRTPVTKPSRGSRRLDGSSSLSRRSPEKGRTLVECEITYSRACVQTNQVHCRQRIEVVGREVQLRAVTFTGSLNRKSQISKSS